MFPITYKSYYSLACVDPRIGLTCFFDSLKCHPTDKIKACLLAYLKAKYTGRSWSFDQRACAQQRNTNDCDIYVVVNALHLFANRPIPQHLYSAIWRQVLNAARCGLAAGDLKVWIKETMRYSLPLTDTIVRSRGQWKHQFRSQTASSTG